MVSTDGVLELCFVPFIISFSNSCNIFISKFLHGYILRCSIWNICITKVIISCLHGLLDEVLPDIAIQSQPPVLRQCMSKAAVSIQADHLIWHWFTMLIVHSWWDAVLDGVMHLVQQTSALQLNMVTIVSLKSQYDNMIWLWSFMLRVWLYNGYSNAMHMVFCKTVNRKVMIWLLVKRTLR